MTVFTVDLYYIFITVFTFPTSVEEAILQDQKAPDPFSAGVLPETLLGILQRSIGFGPIVGRERDTPPTYLPYYLPSL